MLGNIPGARQVFERWMEWEPEEQAWFSYIKMELRYKEADRARAIYEKFVMVHSDVKNWIKFAKFEELQGKVGMFCFPLVFLLVIHEFKVDQRLAFVKL